MVSNVLKVYTLNKDFNYSGDWYVQANSFCAEIAQMYHLKLETTVGMLAALSPLKNWEQNKLILKHYLETGEVKHTKVFTNKVVLIHKQAQTVDEITSILRGQKIISFFLNILYPTTSEQVTIDRHAASIVFNQKLTGEDSHFSIKQYISMQQAYIVAAKKVDLPALQLQAITWDIWKSKFYQKKAVKNGKKVKISL